MLQDLNDDQLQLARLMSRISEEGYSAGWMEGLEYELWEILNGGKNNYGRHVVTQEQLQQLRFLSDKYGCWIVFDDDTEETAVDLEMWTKMFPNHMLKGSIYITKAIFLNLGGKLVLNAGPKEKLHEDFYVLKIPHNGRLHTQPARGKIFLDKVPG